MARRSCNYPSAVGYVRVSTKEQAVQGTSLRAQEDHIRRYCLDRGLTLTGIVRDEGVSGGVPLRKRPNGAKLLDAVPDGSHVVAVKLDRLFRDAIDCLTTVRAWDACGVALHLLDVGGTALDTASANGRFFLTVMAGASEMEKNSIRERVQAVADFRRVRGLRTGQIPFGFAEPVRGRAMTRVASEQATIREIVRRHRRGQSLRTICRALDNRRRPTRSGALWRPATVRRIIQRVLTTTR